MEGEYRKTSREGWRTALEISAWSLVGLTNHAVPLMKEGGAILALSYVASQRVFPNYNVMGSAKAALEHAVRQLAFELGPMNIRVNCISAGPVPTLSARGISGFTDMAQHHRRPPRSSGTSSPERWGQRALPVQPAGLESPAPPSTWTPGTTSWDCSGARSRPAPTPQCRPPGERWNSYDWDRLQAATVHQVEMALARN